MSSNHLCGGTVNDGWSWSFEFGAARLPASPHRNIFHSTPSAHFGKDLPHHITVPCCSSCFSQHNKLQFHWLVAVGWLKLRLRWRGRGKFATSGGSVVNLFCFKSILSNECRESKVPFSMLEIWLPLRWSSLRFLSPENNSGWRSEILLLYKYRYCREDKLVKTCSLMKDSWFISRWSFLRVFSPANRFCWRTFNWLFVK